MTEFDGNNKCTRCLYSDKYGRCKKCIGIYNECLSDYHSWFESKYILDDETGEIDYSEEFEEDIDDDLWHEMCLSDPNLSEQ